MDLVRHSIAFYWKRRPQVEPDSSYYFVLSAEFWLSMRILVYLRMASCLLCLHCVGCDSELSSYSMERLKSPLQPFLLM